MAIQTLPESDPASLRPGAEDESRQGPTRKLRKKRSKLRWLGIVTGAVLCALLLIIGIAVGVMMFLARRHCFPIQGRTGAPAIQRIATQRQRVVRQDSERSAGDGCLHIFDKRIGVGERARASCEHARLPGHHHDDGLLRRVRRGLALAAAVQPLRGHGGLSYSNGVDRVPVAVRSEEFYGATDRRNFVCSAGSVLLPASAHPARR